MFYITFLPITFLNNTNLFSKNRTSQKHFFDLYKIFNFLNLSCIYFLNLFSLKNYQNNFNINSN